MISPSQRRRRRSMSLSGLSRIGRWTKHPGHELTRLVRPVYSFFGNGSVRYRQGWQRSQMRWCFSSHFVGPADHPSPHFTGSFTIAGWIYPETSTPTINPMVSKSGGAGSSHSYFLLYNEQTPDTEFAVSRDGTDVVTVVAPGVLAINTWHFIVGWFDASEREHTSADNDGTPTSLRLAGRPAHRSLEARRALRRSYMPMALASTMQSRGRMKLECGQECSDGCRTPSPLQRLSGKLIRFSRCLMSKHYHRSLSRIPRSRFHEPRALRMAIYRKIPSFSSREEQSCR